MTGSLKSLVKKRPATDRYSSAEPVTANKKRQATPRGGLSVCVRNVAQQNPDEILSEREAAAYLRVAISTMQAWRLLKRGPKYARLVRRIVYKRADLEKFLQARMVEPRDGRKRVRV